MLFFIWFACMVYSIGMIKLNEENPITLQICTIMCLVIIIAICINPFHCFYQRTRKQILFTLWHILISPFGLVRFRHFFLADVLTSIVTPIQFVGIIYCYYLGEPQDWRVPVKPTHNKDHCRAANGWYIAAGFIPYWFRFWQCINKKYYTGNNAHLLNAIKYFSDMLIPFAGLPLYFKSYRFDHTWQVFLYTHLFASVYSYIWDVYMDFGLCRHFENDERKYLRSKIMYAPSFYWYMCVSDFILRFVWVPALWHIGKPGGTWD